MRDGERLARPGEPSARDFRVGPDVVLHLHADGTFAGFRSTLGRRPRTTQAVRVPGSGDPVPGAFDLGVSRVRFWRDIQGRVAAAQVI